MEGPCPKANVKLEAKDDNATCSDAEKNAKVCTMEYMPVCGVKA